jgi:hypothetical protein
MKHIRISREDSFEYMHSNNIEKSSAKDLCGCFVLKEIVTVTSSGNNYFVLERFDGAKYIVLVHDLTELEKVWKKDTTTTRNYDIANVYYDNNFNCHIKKHYNRSSYIPTAKSIVSYIRQNWSLYSNYNSHPIIDSSGLHDTYGILDYRGINVKAVNMTKQQMESLKAKLNLLGVRWKLVDYNTIAVARSKEIVDIYTQQRKVITFPEFNEDNMFEELNITF